jgi:hypothetical protein
LANESIADGDRTRERHGCVAAGVVGVIFATRARRRRGTCCLTLDKRCKWLALLVEFLAFVAA